MFAHKLGRVLTSGRRFIAEVDGLRFIAITAVVLYHLKVYTLGKHMTGATIQTAESWLPKMFENGQYGVHLFFVLSGFLLALPFAKWRLGLGARPMLRTYYLRRLTRLEPPYIVSMLILFVGGCVAFGFATGLARWPNLLASLVYQHNLIYGGGSIINGVAWSLEVEVQFYVLAPLLTTVFSIGNMVARRFLLSATMVAVPLLRNIFFPHLSYGLPKYLEFFVAGFLLADLFLVDWKEAPEHSLTWDGASLVGWLALVALLLWKWSTILIAPTILFAYVGAFRGRVSSWLLSRPPITVIGGMCYSMYLLHHPVISMTGRFAQRFLWGSNFTARFTLEALIAMPVILAVTGVYFIVLERPCMDSTWPAKVRQVFYAWFGGAAGTSDSSAESAPL